MSKWIVVTDVYSPNNMVLPWCLLAHCMDSIVSEPKVWHFSPVAGLRPVQIEGLRECLELEEIFSL